MPSPVELVIGEGLDIEYRDDRLALRELLTICQGQSLSNCRVYHRRVFHSPRRAELLHTERAYSILCASLWLP